MTESEAISPPPRNELPWVMEALLFVAEEPQTIGALARAAGVGEGAARRALEQLAGDYLARGLRVQRDRNTYQLVTSPQYAKYVSRLLGKGPGAKLSRAALETLTIIAYRQPCTRAEIEAVRGVNSDRMVAVLEQRGLIDSVGRAEQPGRPKLYRPTMQFYEHFGLTGPDDLPPLPEEPEEPVDPF